MTVYDELEQIRADHGGMLFPQAVVEFARDESTDLHSRFEWDDSIAGENYRIWQARQVIRAAVTIIPRNNDPIVVQTYVSMKSDRYQPATDTQAFNGGYRCMVDVLAEPELRRTLLDEAMEEHDLWEQKYQSIRELVDIFEAAKTIKQRRALVPA